MRFAKTSIVLLAGIAAGCTTSMQVVPAGQPIGKAPYIAVQKQLPKDENRIYLLAALPGRIVIVEDCVLFERLGGAVVLPVFEYGVVAGRDRHGAWVYDPFTEEYFRDRTKVFAGGGGSGETITELRNRNVLQRAVPERCSSATSDNEVLTLNPGLNAADFDE